MTVRHESLTLARGIVLRRTHNDGKQPERSLWAGREWGWLPDTLDNRYLAKAYSQRGVARAALARILAHERELGIASRIGRRY